MKPVKQLFQGVLLALLITGAGCVASGTAAPPTVIATGTSQALAAAAPIADCAAFIEQAVRTARASCASAGLNQLCYGFPQVSVAGQPGTQPLFSRTGDRLAVAGLTGIFAAPLSLEQQSWGIAFISLPDSPEGIQAAPLVTLVLVGDVALEATTPDFRAFQLSAAQNRDCVDRVANGLLIQASTGKQPAFRINGALVSSTATLFITAQRAQSMQIVALDGVGVISANNRVQVVQPGMQVVLSLGGAAGLDVNSSPSLPEPVAQANITRLPLALLPAPVEIPAAAPTLVPVSTQPPDATAAGCMPRADWEMVYVVQRGDNLLRLSQLFGVPLDDLMAGNCLTDPNRIVAGQELRLPSNPTARTPTPLPSTPTPVPIDFAADPPRIAAGVCTTLVWSVPDAEQVLFEGQSAGSVEARQVCPQQTTTYTLLVIFPTGRQEVYSLTVEVE